jgi:prepilin-type N-terminal cleavage/methylation domain-containing protein
MRHTPDDSACSKNGAHSQSGYSLIEVMVAMTVLAVLGSFAVPMVESTTNGIKLHDQAEAVASLVGLAKMRATSQFSKSRVYADLISDTYVMQLWDRDAGTWVNDDAVVTLPNGVEFGFGKVDEPPPNTQDKIGFATACTNDLNQPIDKTACINFNSRGIPIDAAGSPVGGNAFYLTDGTGVRAVTVTATPLIHSWWSSAAAPGWVRQ